MSTTADHVKNNEPADHRQPVWWAELLEIGTDNGRAGSLRDPEESAGLPEVVSDEDPESAS